ncbi:hypothetical protein [Pseudoxanthomonas sp. GM95]|uniref:hypothetical protein n=1 Tax=Pseudoxanthomonas sp. GM95 TaxID=1881043 RepID=UPI0011142BA1|nr:hypothetical protein [Pseudoxanthomonas sp. GM95]
MVIAILLSGWVAAFATTTPKPWWLTLLGLGLGSVMGILRSRAARAGTSTRTATVLGWLGCIALLVLAMAFAEDMFLGAWATSVLACLLVDRACSFVVGYWPAANAAGSGKAG